MVTMQKKSSHLLNFAIFDLLTVDGLYARTCVRATVRNNGATFLHKLVEKSALECNCLTSAHMAKNCD